MLLTAALLALLSAPSTGMARGGDPAGDAQHWAYLRPRPPALPPASFPGWAENPIDLLVGAALARAGLMPSPPASRAELLRRASLDLTGLPPTLDELDAFLQDEGEDAYARVLERLLASPHYGEHQASRWLDLARYADTRGYEKDSRREMWRYRDWVIEAFQRDLPFDQFTIEQLAGDLLPEATLEQRIATGFQRNTLVNEEGGVDPEEFRVAAVKDRVNTTALVWLGSTLECAQCHDHKYDPFSQLDYYRFYAFFDGTEDGGSSDAPAIPAPTEAFTRRTRALEEERAELGARLTPDACAAERETWRAAWSAASSHWRVLRPDSFQATGGSRLALLADDSVLAVGPPPDADDYTLAFTLAPGALQALRLEVLSDESLPGGGPGRPAHQNFVLGRVALALDGVPLALRAARSDHHQPGYGPEGVLDDDPRSGWAIGGGEGAAHTLLLELAEPLALEREARLTLLLEQRYGSHHLVGRVRLAAGAESLPTLEPVPAPDIAAQLASGDDEQLGPWFVQHSPALAPVRARLAEIERELVPPQALVLRELPGGRRTHLHERGNFLSLGLEVTPGVPAVLPPLAAGDARASRLDLARWLMAEENPLTARVSVNRLWQRLFGVGLVATDNDFGLRGELPSQPELLDWLALEYRARGWSTKAMLRLILSSATYRQSSRASPALLARDPGNRLLARGPKQRLEAETLRDLALSVAGLLDPAIGGPSVFPPQPEGVWQSPYSADRWQESSGAERYRRGLYTFLKRSAPYPTFLLFDAPSRELACSRRDTSNTPLQALALLNDPAFVECAQALAARMRAAEPADDEARLRFGFRLCTARAPDADELAILTRLLAAERAAAGDPALAEQRAWNAAATVLLNLDETITRS